jgi:hypothetical protein
MLATLLNGTFDHSASAVHMLIAMQSTSACAAVFAACVRQLIGEDQPCRPHARVTAYCADAHRFVAVDPLTIIPVVALFAADQLPAAIPGSAVAVCPPLVGVGRGVRIRAAELRL